MAHSPARPRHRLEIAVVTLIAVVIIGPYLQEGGQLYERVASHQIGQTLSGLQTAVATTALDARGIGPGDNPVALLERPPAGYHGERAGITPAEAPPGSWYFDPDRGALIYRPREPDRLETIATPPVDATPHLALHLTQTEHGRLQLDPIGPWRWPEKAPKPAVGDR